MKKITTIFKKILLVTIVLAMTQSCIPTTPGGTPTPTTNQFNINLILGDPFTTGNVENDTIISIDNDSIAFRGYTQTEIGGLSLEWEIYFKSSSHNTYQFLTKNGVISILQQNINIPSGLDSTYSWSSPNAVNPNGSFFNRADFDRYVSKSNIYADPFLQGGNWIYGDPKGYIVFRTIIGSSYQYYWIRVGISSFNSFYFSYSSAFYNGRYNLGSIVTGI